MNGDRDFSRLTFNVAVGIFVLWGVWALVYEVVEDGLNYGAFGFFSPVVGLFLLAFSLAGLRQATQRNAPKRWAIASIVLSIAIAVLPVLSLLTGIACDGPCYT